MQYKKLLLVVVALSIGAAILGTQAQGQSITAEVAVGLTPDVVAINPVTNKVYVTDTGLGKVTVVDGATNATSTITVGSLPQAIAVNTVTNKIYVANSGLGLVSSTITVIDGATNATSTITLGSAESKPCSIAVNTTTNKIYVSNYSGSVTVIDGSTNATSNISTPSGTFPVSLTVDVTTNKIYVACVTTALLFPPTQTLSVIDGSNNALTSVAAGQGLFGVALNISTDRIYLGSDILNTFVELDGSTNGALISVSAGLPKCIAVNSATGKVYYVT
ncbi:MAG TPA: YncE family protein, partial [Opitutaceae bacterium]|nr:YncE family protein [Opitutaceae bacterium]